eukprot:9624587-Alexandrium_andersonii.AAC.1
MVHEGAQPAMLKTAAKHRSGRPPNSGPGGQVCAGYGRTATQCEFQRWARAEGGASASARAPARCSSFPVAFRQ